MLDRLFGSPLRIQNADFRFPPDVVLRAAEEAINNLPGMTLEESLPIPDSVARRTDVQATTQHENVQVSVNEPVGGFTRTVVSSAGSVFGSGKRAQRNVELVLVEMSRLLDEHGEEWARESR